MFCPKCGFPVTDGAKFCQKCGQPLTVQNENKAFPPTGSSGGGNQAISIIEKVLGCCFALFFILRVILVLVNYVRFLYYGARWYNGGFIALATFMTVILTVSLLLLAGTVFACGWPRDRSHKAHLLLAVAAAVIIRLLNLRQPS